MRSLFQIWVGVFAIAAMMAVGGCGRTATDYYVSVTGSDSGGDGSEGNLQTTNRTCNANDFIIELGWSDNANNEDGYRVYRNQGLIATLGPNATSYSDTPSYTGPHSYQVQAFNAAGEANSNSIQEQSCIF